MNVRDVLPRDAIQSLDEPTFASEHAGDPDDAVVVVDGDPPKAYPVRILSAHEIANDVVDPGGRSSGGTTDAAEADASAGEPIAVTWCPICWSAAVYDARVEGEALTFGVSGKLADDALVVYDRQTGSEWRQTSGVAIAGPLDGAELAVLPSSIVTARQFREAHPEGVVLQPARGPDDPSAALETQYSMAPYEQYVEREAFGLYGMRGEGEPRPWERTDLDAKTLVLGVAFDGEAVAYPEPAVEAAGGVVTDRVGDRDVVVFAADGGLYAYEDPGLAFDAADRANGADVADGAVVADGATWDPLTGESSDGRALDRLPSRQLFAFAWQDVHGPDAFYESP